MSGQETPGGRCRQLAGRSVAILRAYKQSYEKLTNQAKLKNRSATDNDSSVLARMSDDDENRTGWR